MSRLGKKPIPVPKGVTVSVADGTVVVKGPKGELKLVVHPRALVTFDAPANEVRVTVVDPGAIVDRGLWGLTHKLVKNMLTGVTDGFTTSLELVGVGFKVSVAGSKINLDLGFSHPVVFELPAGVTAKAEKNVLTLAGADKQIVGQTAAQIRKLRKPEPYKGKGIRYVGEAVRQKAGKAAKAGAAAK